jgi:hypothetical protein
MAHTRSFLIGTLFEEFGHNFPPATLEQEKKYLPLHPIFHILDDALLERVRRVSSESAPRLRS